MKVILSPNPYRDLGLKAAQSAKKILERSGVEAMISLPFTLDEHSRVEIPQHLKLEPLQDILPGADMLICFGGDGTILHAAKDATPHNIPILGVNMGSVGFMAELEHSELNLLSRLVDGKYEIEERMMLEAVVKRDGKVVFSETALNDAVLTKGAVARVLDLEVTGDRVAISAFSGDGIIVATPTGSTAYSMAAGGPIVEPTARNIIVTPICAHSLKVKPMVLDRHRTVGIRLEHGSRRSAYLSVDGGRAFKVLSGDRVEVSRAEKVTRLVKLTGRSFYELVHQKLGKG